jgi:anti-sigma factor RsiW
METSMSCKSIREQLITMMEGALSDSEAVNCSLHLSSCPECNAFHEELKATLSLIATDKITFATKNFPEEILKRINHKTSSAEGKKVPFFGKTLNWTTAAAAAILLGIGGSWSVFGLIAVQPESQLNEIFITPAGVSDEPIEALLLSF